MGSTTSMSRQKRKTVLALLHDAKWCRQQLRRCHCPPDGVFL